MKKSFTLIELVVVIAILGIIVGLSIPNLNPFLSGVKMNAAVKLAVADLRLAQEKAIAENTTYEIIFQDNAYTIKSPSFLKKISFPSDVKVEAPQTIKFANSGNTLPGYSGTITLTSNNKTKRIIISTIGRVRVE